MPTLNGVFCRDTSSLVAIEQNIGIGRSLRAVTTTESLRNL